MEIILKLETATFFLYFERQNVLFDKGKHHNHGTKHYKHDTRRPIERFGLCFVRENGGDPRPDEGEKDAERENEPIGRASD